MCAVPNMAVFCSSLTSCFPGMMLMYFLNDFETVPVAPVITGITFVFTFHMCCIYIVRFLYFRIFSASFLITFVSPEIATSINIYVPFCYWNPINGSVLGSLLHSLRRSAFDIRLLLVVVKGALGQGFLRVLLLPPFDQRPLFIHLSVTR